ncbi:MAG: hypothetical protein ACREDV_06710, partial [Methylocella sp.]
LSASRPRSRTGVRARSANSWSGGSVGTQSSGEKHHPCGSRPPINVSTVLAGQRLGIKEVDDGIWLASFMTYDLGYFDLEQKTLQPLDDPFGPRLSPMS